MLYFKKSLSLYFAISLLITLSSLKGEYQLVELMPDFDYGAWFKAQSAYKPNSLWFGSWAIAPKGDEIYFGFGAARPAESDGAMLAVWKGDTFEPLGKYTEQGIHLLQWLDDTLYSAGSDPTGSDGWDAGNFYKYVIGGKLTKIRYDSAKKAVLPNVIHSWGFNIDPATKRFYMGTGSYDPAQYSKNKNDCGKTADSNIACFGEVWQSDDFGASWQLNTGGKDRLLSDNRIYDVIRFGNYLYVTDGEQSGPNKFKRSSDDGKTWETVSDIIPSLLVRMCIFNGRLIVASTLARQIYIIDSSGNHLTQFVPGVFNYSFNSLSNVDDRYLITYFSDGSIHASSNLIDWTELIPPTSKNFLSIGYWSNNKSIIVAERDSIGRIWKLDISELLASDVADNGNNSSLELFNDNIILKVKSSFSEFDKLEIYDFLGRNISFSQSIRYFEHSANIDISHLQPGVYFVRAGNRTAKFVKY